MRPAYTAALGLALLYGLSLATGVLFTLTGFVQSDTCWLVKLGQVILKTHSIPSIDPLSFTLPLLAQAGFAQPFVMYQWLSEVIFALAFRLLSLNGLLLLSANVTVLASICLLFRFCCAASNNLVVSFLLVTLATATVALRFMVRPEIFTLLFIVLWLFQLRRLSSIDSPANADAGTNAGTNAGSTAGSTADATAGSNAGPNAGSNADPNADSNADPNATVTNDKPDGGKLTVPGIDLRTTLGLTLTMIIWCNLHSGFVIGLMLLLVYGISSFCQDKIAKRTISRQTKTSLAALAACALGTLLNPAGPELWAYLPRLYFLPMRLSIAEVRSISLRELLMPIYYPFFVLLAVSGYAVFRAIKGKSTDYHKLLGNGGKLSSVIVIVTATIVSLLSKRLASPLALILACETASLIGCLVTSQPQLQFFRKKVSILALELPTLILATAGVLGSSDRMIPLTMPQASVNSNPSFQSLEYLWDHWHGGNIFNSVQMGSVLTMYGPPKMKVFVDTRIDAYGEKILYDYCLIVDARGPWKELLDRYQIEWVAITQRVRLGAILRQTPGWTKEYEDPDVVIFRRSK